MPPRLVYQRPHTPPADHLEGYVSELVWYFLTKETPPDDLVRLEPLGFAATDSGGDGLAIHKRDDGELFFRLWEIKKKTGSGSGNVTPPTAN